jgi:signal transduction histidine kinase
MNKAEAFALLRAPASDDRLRAARFLGRTCIESDLPFLRAALTAENNKWVKGALSKAIATAQAGIKQETISIAAEGEDDRILEQIYAEAVEETTKRLVHEIRPILGRLDVRASTEIIEYTNSKTKKEWTRLAEFLAVIDKLSQAASSPIYAEFDLSSAIEEIAASERSDCSISIECAGPKPLVILGACSYIQIILTNAIRNAVEATREIAATDPIVVTWGSTDRDHWFSVLDRGCGLPAAANKIFEIGSTTKKDHLGMGLALSRQAGLSINGKISLGPRESSGTRFEFRWPKISK